MDFQAGDRVKIIETSEYYDDGITNPTCEGTIESTSYWNKELPILVNWPNGIQNSYAKTDLVKIYPNIPKLVYTVKQNTSMYEFNTEQEALDKINELRELTSSDFDWDNFIGSDESSKTVNYFGKDFELPQGCHYIATDSDGHINAYYNKPELNYQNKWMDPNDLLCEWLGFFPDGISFDFKKSLVEYE